MSREIQKDLPPKYYLDNFNALLGFAEKMYGPLLKENEREFIDAFRRLSEDARCLFLRFANRKGLFFRTDKLHYPELSSLERALDELLFHQFCTMPAADHAPMASLFLQVYSRPELVQLCKCLNPAEKGISGLKKPEVIELLLSNNEWDELLEAAGEIAPVVKHNFEQELELLKFLFFGHTGGDMSEFVIRDLGLVRYEEPEEHQLVARFNKREEVDELFELSLAYPQFKELREGDSDQLYSWYMSWSNRRMNWCAQARPLFNRLTLKLARTLERQQQPQWALEVYERTDDAPSRERRARLLQKTGAVQEALELCYRMEESPHNADELFFARDFSSRLLKKKRPKSTTLHLREAEAVAISSDYRYQVEKGVMQHFIKQGQEAMYSENYLWRSLFGLVFWDIVFDHEAPVYHSPLQRVPSDLYLPSFLESRQGAMQERLQELDSSGKLLSYIERVYEEKWGLGNPLLNWHENTLPLLRAVVGNVAPQKLASVLMGMARNLKENGRGFPDLFTWTAKDYAFIEVKSPNDTLSAQQLSWLQFFQQHGISARVLKVEWVQENEF
ncbi:VRR-NUC domain-containing protein [Nafulsella turpanensis]|uniref:VRR-NUC domain-containing protein n=1 Tax=Nafulsella turpanensis TaxID=1265690 RepID=UPI00037FCE00|nr:VRR-NUC domain-containing protein [Nafulsella turpanensis]